MTTNNINNILELRNEMFHLVNMAWCEKKVSDSEFQEISRILGQVAGMTLPQHPDNVSRETYSPEPRNRTEDTQPTTMGNTNNKENNMNIEEALQVLVTHITEQVTEAMESAISDAISDALSDYDPTEHMDFEDAVRNAVSGMTVTID